MAQLLFGVPASTSPAAVAKACSALPGPLAIKVEAHKLRTRKLRWVALFGSEERDVEETIMILVSLLPKLVIALAYDTTGLWVVRTLEKRGARVVVVADDEGEDGRGRMALTKRFSKADADAFVAGAVDYASEDPGWRSYGRLSGKLVADTDDALDVDNYALDWAELVDWLPEVAEGEPEGQRGKKKPSKRVEPPPTRVAPPPPPAGPRDVPMKRKVAKNGVTSWSAPAKIEWEVSDACGLIGRAAHEFALWTTDAGRSVVRSRSEGLDKGFRILGADDTHVYVLGGGEIRRFARAGEGADVIARGPWTPSAVVGAGVDEEHVYIATKTLRGTVSVAPMGIHRVPKQGGELALFAEEWWQEPAPFFAVGTEAVFTSKWQLDSERYGIVALPKGKGKGKGKPRLVEATPMPLSAPFGTSASPLLMAAAGRCVAWCSQDESTVTFDAGGKRRVVVFEGTVFRMLGRATGVFVLEWKEPSLHVHKFSARDGARSFAARQHPADVDLFDYLDVEDASIVGIAESRGPIVAVPLQRY